MNKEEIIKESWFGTKDKVLSLFSIRSYINHGVGSVDYFDCLNNIKIKISNMFDEKFSDVIKLNEDNFEEFVILIRKEIKNIKYKIIDKYVEEKWIDVLASILSNIEVQIGDIFLEFLRKEEEKQNKPINKFMGIKNTFLNILFKQEENKEKKADLLYKELAEDCILKMIEEFNLASIHLVDNHNWNNNFKSIQYLYEAIKKSHHKIGLPTENLGCYKNLNIIITNGLIYNDDWTGFQSKTNASFSIFINMATENLDLTWIHEYTHFLDRMAAHSFYQEKESENELSTFSHIALDYVTNGENIRNKPLKIVAETMSAIIGGVSSDSFYININNSVKKLKDSITMDIIDNMLDYDKSKWNSLTEPEKQLIVGRSKITEIVNFVLLETSNYHGASFSINQKEDIISVEGDKKINSGISILNIVDSVCEKTNKLERDLIYKNLQVYFYKKITPNINFIMKHNNLCVYKEDSVYSERFFLSLGNDISIKFRDLQEKAGLKFSYYDKPLEMLAKMSESLLFPIDSNCEYKDRIYSNNNTKELILGREERLLVCLALHSMARYIGINVNVNNYHNIPCLMPQNVESVVSIDIFENKKTKINSVIPNGEVKIEILSNVQKIAYDFFKEEVVYQKRRLV